MTIKKQPIKKTRLLTLQVRKRATAHRAEVKSFGATPRKPAICEKSIAEELLTTSKGQDSDGCSPKDLPQLYEQLRKRHGAKIHGKLKEKA